MGDVVVWGMDGIAHAGAISDPIEGWLRCGPSSAFHTVINGRFVVRNSTLVDPNVAARLAQHRTVATRMQAP